ncbi:SASA family carbohydrate esterase [Escherichia coli]|uniref:Sialate O-acetylesterase n=1 Tax=Escherichia coli TaxID=562 RepID=A0AAP7PCP3_ECOLX|nr:SASA family carbohydrate esterase [Escherichia coli]OKB74368.1 sialate O-acetylesterase [Escherichia coli]
MAFKHYDVVRAASPSDLAERLTQKLKEGWQPFGSPVAITPYTLMQAIAAEGDVTTPVVVKPSGDGSTVISTTSEPEYYLVVVLAGQSNSMAYGEGLPLPETYDRPDPRIKQLARRSTVTPGGAACAYNDIIPADHCLHDVQNMSGVNHPKADLSKGQYGTVGQGLHIAKKLLPFIPANVGILLVPCCRGASAFTTGADGTYSESAGASENSLRWGVGKPLYQDLVSRTKAALAKNPKNRLLAVVWMQGEGDAAVGTHAQHTGLFTAMVNQFRTDLAGQASQCTGGNASAVPWICGDTTYFWKQRHAEGYASVYGGYKGKESQNIFFVPLMTDENGANVQTNDPAEDPDLETIGYYGSKWRNDQKTWTSADRASHFSSWSRRGIISDRLATAILTHAGRVAVSTEKPASEPEAPPSPPSGAETTVTTTTGTTTLLSYSAGESEGKLSAQGWRSGGGRAEIVDDAGGTGGKAMKITKETGKSSWYLENDAGTGAELLKKGGVLSCRFKVPGALVANQYVMAFYWPVSSLPEGVSLGGDAGNNLLASFYIQTDATDLNVLYHNAKDSTQNQKLGTFGAFDNDWHTLAFRFAGNNSLQVTPVIDGKDGAAFTLTQSPVGAFPADKLRVTDITKNATYPVLIDSVKVEVNNAEAGA